jgi:transposase-like protein
MSAKLEAMYRNWALRRKAIVAASLEPGMTIAKVATRFGVSRESIKRILKKEGAPRRDIGKRSRDEMWVAFIAAIHADPSLDSVGKAARAAGVNEGNVESLLVQMGHEGFKVRAYLRRRKSKNRATDLENRRMESIAALHQYIDEHGKRPTSTQMIRNAKSGLPQALWGDNIIPRFGSYTKFLREANIDPEATRPPHPMKGRKVVRNKPHTQGEEHAGQVQG